jgi:hypothetical protein
VPPCCCSRFAADGPHACTRVSLSLLSRDSCISKRKLQGFHHSKSLDRKVR